MQLQEIQLPQEILRVLPGGPEVRLELQVRVVQERGHREGGQRAGEGRQSKHCQEGEEDGRNMSAPHFVIPIY